MKIWTLTVDGRQEVITTVHTSEASVFESLRVNYAEDEDVSDLDLMDHVIAQGNSVYVNEHEITPDPSLVFIERVRGVVREPNTDGLDAIETVEQVRLYLDYLDNPVLES